jgi:hypothetical protein
MDTIEMIFIPSRPHPDDLPHTERVETLTRP